MNWKQQFVRSTVQEVDPPEAQSEYLAGAALIDVREPHEFAAGHAPGAELLPLGQLSRELQSLPRDREILFICRSGNRSELATQIAERAGLRARNVRGGMIAWSRHGLPVER